MILSTIVTALENLGYTDGWAANDIDGIVLWENQTPQPTDDELVAAGWIQQKKETEPE